MLKKMKPLNSSKSHRLLDLVPSVKPSVVSVILVFVCGVLWVRNETTNERLIALESRLHCFSCVKSISTENLDKMTPSPTKHSAKYHHKNIYTDIHFRRDRPYVLRWGIIYLVLRVTFRHNFKFCLFFLPDKPLGEVSSGSLLLLFFW